MQLHVHARSLNSTDITCICDVCGELMSCSCDLIASLKFRTETQIQEEC